MKTHVDYKFKNESFDNAKEKLRGDIKFHEISVSPLKRKNNLWMKRTRQEVK